MVIVENEITYLALPERPDTLAIFGSGFALGSVVGFGWLQNKLITYWGDIDTYGFLILNRLRARYPQVESILMDVDSLLAHRPQWVTEEKPTSHPLPHLTEAEAALYRDLIEDRYGSRPAGAGAGPVLAGTGSAGGGVGAEQQYDSDRTGGRGSLAQDHVQPAAPTPASRSCAGGNRSRVTSGWWRWGPIVYGSVPLRSLEERL